MSVPVVFISDLLLRRMIDKHRWGGIEASESSAKKRAPHRGSGAIERVRNKGGAKFYRITEYGKSILNRNPSDVSIKDL